MSSSAGNPFSRMWQWLTRLFAARSSRGSSSRTAVHARDIDPFALGEPWRRLAIETRSAYERYRRAADEFGSTHSTAIERTTDHLNETVADIFATATRGNELSKMHAAMGHVKIQKSLDQLDDGPDDKPRRESLQRQLQTCERINASIAHTEKSVRTMNTRLDETISETLAIAAGNVDETDLSRIDGQLTSITNDLTALRQAIDEVDSIDATGSNTLGTSSP